MSWKYVAFGAVVIASGGAALVAAGGVASLAGGLGLLGAAGTGTTISTLSGAALSSASLAAIGGSVLGGQIVIAGLGSSAAVAVCKICDSIEKGNFEEADEQMETLAKKNPTDMAKFYKNNKSTMSPSMRKRWKKHLNS
jgi:hypothetical protein